MFFDKPDIRYVDMCIYIDNNAYTSKCENDLIYEYLYHIIMMLSVKWDYFDSVKTADDFSLYAASVYYMRLKDKRQFEENSSIEPIRSILNYIKKTLYSIKASYIKKYLKEQNTVGEDQLLSLDLDGFRCFASHLISPLDKCDFSYCLEDIQYVIKDTLKTVPYKKNSVMYHNIYISCILSFLNSITLRNSVLKRINNFKRPTSLTDDLLESLYLRERYNSVILYHLDDSMKNYIAILTNKIRVTIAKELSYTIHKSMPSCVNMKNLLMSNTFEEDDC